MGSSRHLGLIAALLALGLTLGVWWLLQAREIELPAGPPRGSPEVHEDAAAATAPMTTRVAVAGQTNAGIVKLPSEAGLPRTPPCSITAHVMDDAGSPVEGATVEVFAANYERRAPDAQDPREIVWLGPRRDAPLATMTTGSAGTCEFWFERELVYVTASHPRVGRSVVRTVGNRELGSDREVDLWLLRPVVVRGVVLDENCAPIPHARLFCEAATPVGKYGPTGWLSANAVGRFEFEVAAGLSSLVQARQGARLSPRVAFVAENDLEIVVALEGALSLRGVVRDAVGRPVVGASVQVKGFFGDQPVGQGQSRASVAYTPGFSAAITDRDGSFDLRVEACGRYAVAASAEPDLLSAWSEEVVVSFQDPHPRRNLVVAEALVLRVRVRNHDGSEAKMFELNVADAMDGTFILRATLPDGALALHLPLRTPVVLSGEGLTPVRVGPDAGELQLVLQPPPDPVEVTGAVFTSDGEPAKGILVEWFSREMFLMGTRIQEIEGNTFRLVAPRSESDRLLIVTLAGLGLPPAVLGPFRGAGPHHVSVLFPRPATCGVRVLAGGQPAVALEVSLFVEPRGSQGPSRTDAQGRVQFALCAPVRSLVVVKRGREVLARREIVLLPGQNPELTLEVTL